jgi:hypothetical protein
MSDWLLQGVDPKNPEGREFYLHTADDWIDILMVVDLLLSDRFPLNADAPLGHLEDHECGVLAALLDELVAKESTREFLEAQYLAEDEEFGVYLDEDEDDDDDRPPRPADLPPVDPERSSFAGRIDSCLDNLAKFCAFLESCGGFLADCA